MSDPKNGDPRDEPLWASEQEAREEFQRRSVLLDTDGLDEWEVAVFDVNNPAEPLQEFHLVSWETALHRVQKYVEDCNLIQLRIVIERSM
jgi:hypothetical protein